MACDRAFGNIEKAVKGHGDIHDRQTYCDIIKNAVHERYEVIELQRPEFLDVGELIKFVTNHKSQSPYSFSQARRFVFRLNFREGYLLGEGYTTPLGTVRLMPGRGAYRPSKFKLSDDVMPQRYLNPIQLKKPKIMDVEDLIAYIPAMHGTYFRAVLDEQYALIQDPRPAQSQAPEDEEDSDNPNPFLDYASEDSDST